MIWIKENKSSIALAAIVFVYVAINMVLTFRYVYYFNLFPVIVLVVYLAFVRLDIIYYLIAACTPLSIPLIEFSQSSPVDFYIPTEPLLFGVMLIIIYKLFKTGFISKKIINHPVTLAILFNLFWIFITSVTSSLPLVSFKFLLARIWFLATFYLIALYLFRDPRNFQKMIWAYSIPLLIVIVYATARHLQWGLFDKQAAHNTPNPFFRDHTSYGAVLAMIAFAFAGINNKKADGFLLKSAIAVVFLLLLMALVLSYSRAAWVSVIISLLVLIAVRLKIKFRYIALVGILLVGTVYMHRTSIMHRIEKNRQDSSSNIAEHFQSVTNIATDESNLERLNRWASALRMFKERPVFGWGPGTYMFNYAPFQLSSQKTGISTNFGDLGNAHSEYIGPLSEQGLIGSFSFILIVVLSLITGFRAYFKIKETPLKNLVLACILAFITYLIHGFLNNFLDTDKASVLFWGFIALFVSMDIYYKEGKKRNLLL